MYLLASYSRSPHPDTSSSLADSLFNWLQAIFLLNFPHGCYACTLTVYLRHIQKLCKYGLFPLKPALTYLDINQTFVHSVPPRGPFKPGHFCILILHDQPHSGSVHQAFPSLNQYTQRELNCRLSNWINGFCISNPKNQIPHQEGKLGQCVSNEALIDVPSIRLPQQGDGAAAPLALWMTVTPKLTQSSDNQD